MSKKAKNEQKMLKELEKRKKIAKKFQRKLNFGLLAFLLCALNAEGLGVCVGCMGWLDAIGNWGTERQKYLSVKIVDEANDKSESDDDKTNAPFSLTFRNLTFYVILDRGQNSSPAAM